MSSTDLVSALQCLLFVAEEPLSSQRAAEILQIRPEEVAELIEKLQHKLQGHGLHVVHLAGGYSLATLPDYADYVQALLEPDPQRLSRQALEVLAIVAYRQPITRPQIDALRGVNSSTVLNSLIEKDLLRITGRANAPGRPFVLATTSYFLSAFGLSDLDDLPQLELPLPATKAGSARLFQDEEGRQSEAEQPAAEDEAPLEAEDESAL